RLNSTILSSQKTAVPPLRVVRSNQRPTSWVAAKANCWTAAQNSLSSNATAGAIDDNAASMTSTCRQRRCASMIASHRDQPTAFELLLPVFGWWFDSELSALI